MLGAAGFERSISPNTARQQHDESATKNPRVPARAMALIWNGAASWPAIGGAAGFATAITLRSRVLATYAYDPLTATPKAPPAPCSPYLSGSSVRFHPRSTGDEGTVTSTIATPDSF